MKGAASSRPVTAAKSTAALAAEVISGLQDFSAAICPSLVAAPGPAETHKSEPMAKPAEPTAKPAEPPAAESAPAASSATAAMGIAAQAKRPVLLTAPVKRAAGAPPVAAAPPAVAPPPAAPPPPAPAATATGRKIRTEL